MSIYNFGGLEKYFQYSRHVYFIDNDYQKKLKCNIIATH